MESVRQGKASMLIVNIVLALFAFSYLVGIASVDAQASQSTTLIPAPGSLPDILIEGIDPVGAGTASASAASAVSGAPSRVGTAATSSSLFSGFSNFFGSNLFTNIGYILLIGGGAAAITLLLGGSQQNALAAFAAGSLGTLAYQLAAGFGVNAFGSFLIGGGVGIVVFLLLYRQQSQEIVTFSCLPFEAPIGGNNCGACNDLEVCSEYTCKSLGQACSLVNQGSTEERCVWQNPHDVNSPKITFSEVNNNYIFRPDVSVRPPATGVTISKENGNCIDAFTALAFTLTTDEPAQCKIDYNLTLGFDEMNFYVGGDNLFRENHTEALSLPGPAAINAIAPELQNDGEYTLYVRCQDANGNFNQDAFSVQFCVDPGPDTTPPRIVDVSIPSGNPIRFNQTSLNLEVYINEPAECAWSRLDAAYETMEHAMACDTEIFQINNQNLYTCRTTLTGVEDRKDNQYYFRCKDQPSANESSRNVNRQSYPYTVVGTQLLNILSVAPRDITIYGATDTIPVFLEISTDNGANNGVSVCSYTTNPASDANYIEFLDTRNVKHSQRQDLVTGDYTYYFRCTDAGGNSVYNQTSFRVETDREAPVIVRAYREGGLKLITHESAECSYSLESCNFEIDDGISITSTSVDKKEHLAEWIVGRTYHLRCRDSYNNQPNPNSCSLIARPSNDGQRVMF